LQNNCPSFFISTSLPFRTFSSGTVGKDDLLTVSILGPTNAGKSTLFNRLLCKESNRSYRLSVDRGRKRRGRKRKPVKIVGTRLKSAADGGAIVSATAGTTRDRRECLGRIGGTVFRLYDTAGVDGERLEHLVRRARTEDDRLQARMMRQTLEAAAEADLVLLMFDAKTGVTSDLLETARWLRKVGLRATGRGEDTSRGKVLVLANKLEGTHWNYDGSPVLEHLTEATRMGFGEAVPISAEHGEGMADIAVAIEELSATGVDDTDEEEEEEEEETGVSLEEDEVTEKPLRVAILGRQNVGKSTLVNALLQHDRVIVGSTPGLTRDAIAVNWSWNGRPVQLVDTAGIRKRSRRDHSDKIEDLAVDDAMRAMKVADVAVLVLDADARMLRRQEMAIADAIIREGRALVVAANKMDLILEADYTKKDFEDGVRQQLEGRFPMLRKTPIVPTSSLYGEVHDLMPVVFDARDRWARTISTSQLNRWLEEVVDGTPPPLAGGKPVKIKYIMQTKGRPPTFLLFCNTDKVPDHYMRYLTRHFQDTFEMFGMEVRLAIKKSSSTNPFERAKTRGGSGLGGREARKKRLIRELKATGAPSKRGRKSRSRRY
jgi:GTP-binding protein